MGAACHAQAGLSAFTRDDLAQDGAEVYGELSACALRAHLAAKRAAQKDDVPEMRRIDYLPALNTRIIVEHDGRHGHSAARNLLRAQFKRRLYDRRQRARADRVNSSG
jgi:hypothetical protein